MNSRVSVNKCKSCNSFIKPLGIGTIFGAAAILLIILIVSVIFTIIKSFADNLAVPFAILAAALGAFIGGFIAAKILKCRGLFVGMGVGLLLFAVVWLIGLICGSRLFTTAILAQLILMVLSGALGGFWSVNARRKK